jgi:periplasmic copper chaperone A
MIRRLGLFLLSACASCAVLGAQESIRIEHAYARPVPAGVVGAAYFEIENPGPIADRLLSVSTAIATAEVHQMKMDGDVMRMRKVGSIEIPAHGAVEFAPDGYHVMLTHLAHPLAPGDQFHLGLRFEHAGEVDVLVPVQANRP